MRRLVSNRLLVIAAVAFSYCLLVALAYAAGPAAVAPAKPAACVIAARGRISTARGQLASFGGLAVSPSTAYETYEASGPAGPLHVRSTRIDVVSCPRASAPATIAGKATINGASVTDFVIQIRLGSSGRAGDTYRIVLGNGYDSGWGRIAAGAVMLKLAGVSIQHQDTTPAQPSAGSSAAREAAVAARRANATGR